MEANVDESGETSTENTVSFSGNGVATTHKSRKNETGKHGEINNVFSMNSSCDSSSESAKWKPNSRFPNVSAASRNAALLQKFEFSKGSEGLDDASATDISSQNSGLVEIPSPKSMDDAGNSMEDERPIPQVPESKALGEENEDVDKLMKSSAFPDTKDAHTQSHLLDESDDSDIVEQDVKVCDICGDAGREDLLAICCRCSDGAEHTYCMREMLDKVPEGEWLCEECRYDEEMKGHGQDKIAKVDVNDKDHSSGKVTGGNSNISQKLEAKGVDEVEKFSIEHSNIKILGKRHKDDVEVSSPAKKQAIESVLGSPKKSISSSVSSLLRDNSSRHLERGKEKLTHQSSSGAILMNDDTESSRTSTTGPRMQTTRGTFLKSNSFSSISGRPKVKLVDEVVPPKQKLVQEPSSLDIKEGLGKSLGKSMSFKTMNSGRPGTSESKVKMLSPKFSHNQNNKGFKQTKERSLFERKSSFKSERPFLNSPRGSSGISTSKSDKKLPSRGETALPSIGNNRQSKAILSDSKSNTLSKSSSLVPQRSSDVPVSLGEVKRQSVVANELGGSEQKPGPKDDSLVSYVVEKPTYNPNGCPPDGSSRPKEPASFVEKMRDDGNQFKQSIAAGGRADICQKCKEVGHLTQFCPFDGRPLEVGNVKGSRDIKNGSNDLKAAIEAARLRKPGICRKYRGADQSNDLSQASKNSEVVSQDQALSSISRKNTSAAEANEGQKAVRYSNDSCKQTVVESVKQITSPYMETSMSRTGDGTSVPYDEKTSKRDLSCHFPPAISVIWKMLAIPEPEFIWQGNFEVCRSTRVELSEGIQAHLSTCASPKVLGVVNKFPQTIVLNEVPRLSTWPTQFHEYGVREDNLALYFFAEDVYSYEKSYKILLENLIKNDLALKGIIDGIELLIFPSTQLPENSQRWNMLFFLWGVFRGKKTCSQQMPGLPKQTPDRDITTAIMSLPENTCSLGPVEKDLSSDGALVAELPATKDGNGACKVPSLIQMEESKQTNVEHHDARLDSYSESFQQNSSMKSCQEIRCTEGGGDANYKREAGEVQRPLQASGSVVPNRSVFVSLQQDSLLAACDVASSQSKADEVLSSKTTCSREKMNHILGDGLNKEEAHRGRDKESREQIMEDLNRWHLNEEKCSPEDSANVTSSGASQIIKIDDDEDEDVIVLCANERQKDGAAVVFGSNGQYNSSRHGFGLRMYGLPSGSTTGNRWDEACRGTTNLKSGNTERHFFPVGLDTVKDVNVVDNSIPWRMSPLDDELHHRTPNLELALGAEIKLSAPGIPSFQVERKVNQDHDLEKVAKEEEDDMSGSLSLSLSFPFSKMEQNMTSLKTEKLRTEKQHVNT